MNTHKVLSLAKYLLAIPNYEFAWTVFRNRIPLEDMSYRLTDRSLHFKNYNVRISKKQHHFFLEGLNFVKQLVEQFGAQFDSVKTGDLFIDIGGLRYAVQTWEDLHILNEIFVEGSYNLSLDEEVVVIDIGMNVAMTSLFLAKQTNTVAVYGYEPFEMTFKQAQENLKLNPIVARKIKPFNFGLGKSEETLTVDYLPHMKASMGMNGIPPHMVDDSSRTKIRQASIQIKKVTRVLRDVLKKHPRKSFVAKIDCEGAEYEIIEAMYQENLLRNFKGLMIEWHLKGPLPIIQILKDSGFAVLSTRPRDKFTGFVHAFRS